jgi:uncharacterized protein (UPF0261 family)
VNSTIALITTLDTKGEEAGYIKGLIENRRQKTLIVDCGILGEPSLEPHIKREEIASSAGTSMEEVIKLGDEHKAMEIMAKGVVTILKRFINEDKLHGILGLGGMTGTLLNLMLMKELPLGIPKILVSTVPPPHLSIDLMSSDVVLVQTPTDLWGLNAANRMTLASAAAAVMAMAEVYQNQKLRRPAEKPLVEITTLGTSALRYIPCLRPPLEKRGYEVAVLHATGLGGLQTRSAVDLIKQDLITVLLDLAQFDLLCSVCRGVPFPGTDRLDIAGDKGIPIIIAPGAMQLLSFVGSPKAIPEQYKNRPFHRHGLATAVKANNGELLSATTLLIQKANRAKGPVVIIIPKQGFSEFDRLGGFCYDPEFPLLFAQHVKEIAQSHVKVVEIDTHINSPDFSEEVVRQFDKIVGGI